MPNRLAAESSPYLRQHADNPVDWYAWGPEAFDAARTRNCPVLLSVGYAACHWCHVMAHESFEDPGIAALLNEHFVAVKVDREEHPDVDAIYQTVCQAATGQGGWPLTVFLTPDRRPFYAGTYFPPKARYGRPGFTELLTALARAWKEDRVRVVQVAGEWTEMLQRVERGPSPASERTAGPHPEAVPSASEALLRTMDLIHGGFGAAPKFPNTEALEVLLRAGGRAAERAVFTLRAMAGGGIYDHLGGGFHRYSVDEGWRVPHFEKMLYDNALLPPLYLWAFQITADADFAGVARQTLDYLLRDMRSSEGAFYSTEDADSPGPDGHAEEGAFYTWTPEEVLQAVGAHRAGIACRHFGVNPEGNFEGGRTVLHLQAMSVEPEQIEAARAAMLTWRNRRPRPGRDEKVLAGWNGLAVAALAKGSRILGESRYADAARAAAAFVLRTMATPDGGLYRRCMQGSVGIAGTLEDYAYMAVALIDLYEATLEPRWLGEAIRLVHQTVSRFWEPDAAAFYITEKGRADLIQRPRDDGDSGTPAAQSWAVTALLRLRPYVADPTFDQIPTAVFDRSAEMMRQHPRGMASLTCALDLATRGPVEVTFAIPEGAGVPEPWLEGLRRRYVPNLSLSCVADGVPGLNGRPPVWEGRGPEGGRPTLWVCRDGTCRPPAHAWPEVEDTVAGGPPKPRE